MYIPTKELLCRALYDALREHSMDHITVKMVCQRAGVSRQTLYNHYYGLADVLGDMMQREMEGLYSRREGCRCWQSQLTAALKELRDRRPVVLNIWRSSYRVEFLQMLERLADSALERDIRCAGPPADRAEEEEQAFMRDVYLFVFMGLVRRYIAECMEEPPEAVTERCRRMLVNPAHERFLGIERQRGDGYEQEKEYTETAYRANGGADRADDPPGGERGRR